MKLSANLWLALTLLLVFCAILLVVLGGIGALEFFGHRARQAKNHGILDAWWQTERTFETLGFAGLLFGVAGFFCYRRYAKALTLK